MVATKKGEIVVSKRHVSNPLALAVLASLYEQPMHPYQIASLLRERDKHESIKLNYGSLYTVIEALQRDQLIVAVETLRAGRRPERTVYQLTEAGRATFLDWLRELLHTPVKEYTQFAAGLSFAPVLPPAEVIALLQERARRLADEVTGMRERMDAAIQDGVQRLFLIEIEYEYILREAELRWVREIVRAIEDGRLPGMSEWIAFHARRDAADGAETEQEDA
jgi:DNA-binding PadR family transcriptional regulator